MVTTTARKSVAFHRPAMVLIALAFSLPAEAAASQAIRHMPPSEAAPNASLQLRVETSRPAAMVHLRAHYRAAGRRDFENVGFSRLESGVFVADIPASAVREPGIEYFIAARQGALQGNRFASASRPHLVRVRRESDEQRREARLALFDGRRSRASVGLTYVSYGPVSSQVPPDARRAVEQYYALDLDFTYRFLGTLHSLRFGAVRLRGDSIIGGQPLEPASPVGYDYGLAEIRLALGDNLGMAFELQLGANAEHFTFGGSAGVRIGRDRGTNLLIWTGATYLVGARGGLRLHWDTVPSVPMSAGIEVTSWPDSRVGGLRLVYQAEVPLKPGLHLLPELSYQARSARFGRLGGGLRLAYSF